MRLRDPEPIMPDPPGLGRRAVLRQKWTDLAYFHWSYDPEDVQRLLPPGIRVDTFDGRAWVGLIPFVMRDVQIGPTPPVPWLGTFIEVNVRTYVVDERGRRAVWFFSLDVPRAAIVAVARSAFALPYCWATAEHRRNGPAHTYEVTRRWPAPKGAGASMTFDVGDPVEAAEVTDLEHFLTARWALLTARRGRPLYGAVDHPRWPLHRITRVAIEQDVIEAAGLPTPVGEPHAMYSPGVEVKVGWLEKLPVRTA